ncbi:MAG: hypothetical protein J7M34_09190 [Anaerolineae bacterium]|nr:hypothetical protein [Anaerolineae bacterium]
MSTATLVTIQEFNALLKAEPTKKDSTLLKVLRQVAEIDEVKKIRHLVVEPTSVGWS